MGSSTDRGGSPAGREPLTRERILAAALTLIDRDGIDGLSMRRLGAEVDVEAMSLYNHVENKDDVLDGVVVLLWKEVEAQVGRGGAWQEQARAFAAAVRQTAHAHPDAFPLVVSRGVLPSELLRIGEDLLTSLREADFDEVATQAMLAIGSHATSQALAEVSWRGERTERTSNDPGADTWPPIVGVDDQLPRHDTTPFAFGLELIIDGLEALLARRDEPGA